MKSQKLIILGITGSIGDSTLKVLRTFSDRFSLEAFSYYSNFNLAKKLQKEFQVKHIACNRDHIPAEEREYWQKTGVQFYDHLTDLLDIDYDSLLISVVGSIGVRAAYKASQQGRKIMLANKESLIMAGGFLKEAVRNHDTVLIPVDSEHNSLFRLWRPSINRVILTASGGPLRTLSTDEIKTVDKSRVLAHPTWSMGSKITVDSAGMINKSLEIIEAHYLFDVDYQNLSAVIHPQSYIHAIIEHNDGTYFMHTSRPDMVYPIAHALFYPEEPELCLEADEPHFFPDFTFHEIEREKFPGFFLGIESGRQGGTHPAVFNAANEEAVYSFLRDEIQFADIPPLIETALSKNRVDLSDLDSLFEADTSARETVKQTVRKKMRA